jgi:DNA polymerase-3 subunit epsilon
MRYVIATDTETTGLDPSTDVIIEVAAAVYSVEHRCVVETFSVLADSGQRNTAEDINQIPTGALLGAPALPDVIRRLEHLASTYDDAVMVSHGVSFDRAFLEAAGFDDRRELRWVCSLRDVAWPRSKRGASCVAMALAHGVPVVSAHRALTDAMLIAETLRRVQETGHDLVALLADAMRPRVEVVAVTPRPWEVPDAEWSALKDQLTGAGFRYAERPAKGWYGRVVRDEIASLPFAVREVAP